MKTENMKTKKKKSYSKKNERIIRDLQKDLKLTREETIRKLEFMAAVFFTPEK